jgi:hypothetical protein
MVDIAISLIFVYFTLSLLSSEIQELLKTLLQWKAVHLKESIEGLLGGNVSEQTQQQTQALRTLANQLYSNPLISSLNHSAKGTVASKIVPKVTQVFGDQKSGPSKIPASTFAATLLDEFDVLGLYRKLIVARIEYKLVQAIEPGKETEYDERAKAEIDEVLAAYQGKQISLKVAIQKLAEEAQEDQDLFKPKAFKRYFSTPEAVERVTAKLQISLADGIRIVRACLNLKDNGSFQTALKQLGPNPSFDQVRDTLEQLRQTDPGFDQVVPRSVTQAILLITLFWTSPLFQNIREQEQKVYKIPPELWNNLERLADTALTKVDDLSQEAKQFETEISTWFDQSMERAAGVYARNNKLISLTIALLVAVAANADTFYMVDHFSKAGTIESAVVQVAGDLSPADLDNPDRINQLTANITLPLGWTGDTLAGEHTLTQSLVAAAPTAFGFVQGLPFFVLRLPGWIVTGAAISMGASFWYNLLKKFIDVRNAGQEPPKQTTTSANAPSQ